MCLVLIGKGVLLCWGLVMVVRLGVGRCCVWMCILMMVCWILF